MKKIFLFSIMIIVILTLSACETTEDIGFDTSKLITVYTRDTSSGTRAGFMSGIDFVEASEDNSVLVEGFVTKDNTGILTAIGTDEYGIGYISLSSLNSTVKGLLFNGIEPTIENVKNNTYGLKRPFNYILRVDEDFDSIEEEQISKAFIAFIGTIDGSDIISDEGAIPLDSTKTWDDIKGNFSVCSLENSGITIKFGGSDSIEKIAKALTESFSPKCGNFVPEHDHTGSSDGYKRTQGSEKDGDNAKHIGFASRPFKDTEQGIDGTQGQLAWDAIVAIVHLNNELNSVTAEDLKNIFSGTYSKWEDIIE